MKKFLKRVFNDIKESSPNLKDKAVLKRFLVVVALVILSMFAFRNVDGNISSKYELNLDSTRVVLVDHTFNKTMTISKNVWEMDKRLTRTADLLCEIDGIKYYMLNKIKL